MKPSPLFLSQLGNELRPQDIIGDEYFQAFKDFCKFLLMIPATSLEDSDYIARLAPSIVVRSEIQLFNLDIPRFCVRVYLPNAQGFVNLRRMAEVVNRLANEQWLRTDEDVNASDQTGFTGRYIPPTPEPSMREVFASFDNKDNVVADCLLMPPRGSFKENAFYFVTADLGWAYGEGTCFPAIPYVRGMKGFSGGHCAQACAFMVSALLHDHAPPSNASDFAKAGGGLAEITALTVPDNDNFLPLRGLRANVLVRYFVTTGRTVFRHIFPRVSNLVPQSSGDPASRAAVQVISAYVRSGFSPIVAVASPEKLGAVRPSDHNHAVVIVGTHKRNNGQRDQGLVVNDPSHRPFIKWGDSEFRENAFTATQPAFVYCVFPEPIRLPLTRSTTAHRSFYDGNPMACLGVMELSIALQTSLPHLYLAIGIRSPSPNDFLLMQILLESSPKGEIASFPSRLIEMLKSAPGLRERWESSADIKSFAGKWCWVQACIGRQGDVARVELWDAEATPVPESEGLNPFVPDETTLVSRCRGFILASIEKREETWTVTTPRAHQVPVASTAAPRRVRLDRTCNSKGLGWTARSSSATHSPGQAVRFFEQALQKFGPVIGGIRKKASRLTRKSRPVPLRIAALTSFSATKLDLAFSPQCWPTGVLNAQLYGFMHCDDYLFKTIAPPIRGGQRPSVAEYFSNVYKSDISRRDQILDEIAERIKDAAAQSSVSINAVATFMPQLYSLNKIKARQAMDALLCLAELRRKLLRYHTITTIVIAGGSLIQGLVPRVDSRSSSPNRDELILFARRRSREDAYDFLTGRLAWLCRRLAAIHLADDFDFSLALQLEPGPLFVINELDSFSHIARRIDEYGSPNVKRHVGFNIDIAHCVLAGIEPDELFQRNEITKRICHFHISDHGIGHFGDAPLGDCGFGIWDTANEDRLTLLKRWVKHAVNFAKTRATTTTDLYPRFSGLISVELEAARCPSLLYKSCQVLSKMLRQAEQPDAPSGTTSVSRQ